MAFMKRNLAKIGALPWRKFLVLTALLSACLAACLLLFPGRPADVLDPSRIAEATSPPPPTATPVPPTPTPVPPTPTPVPTATPGPIYSNPPTEMMWVH